MKRYKDLKEVLKHVWGVDDNRDTGADAQFKRSMIDPSDQPDSSGNHRRFILEPLPAHLERFNPSLGELCAKLGDAWPEVADSPYMLARYVHLIRETKMIAAGVVPPSFRDTGYCENCGDVPIDFTSKPLVGCPWCHSNKKPEFSN